MTTRLGELAQLVEGQLVGDSVNPIAETAIHDAATLRDVQAGEITLADNPRMAGELASGQAAAAVVGADFPVGETPLIVVENVRSAFAKIVAHFRPAKPNYPVAISPTANIAATAQLAVDVTVRDGVTIEDGVTIGARTVIHPGVVIMQGTVIGEDCVLFPNVVIYHDARIGNQVVLHANVVIGADGFGYHPVAGRHELSVQLGSVIIEDHVDIGACSTVDRGTYGPTVIGEGTKIDNQVMVAHNCRLGKHNILCSQVGIAGSTSTGDYVIMGGQAGVRDHVHIGANTRIGAQSGVVSDVGEGDALYGSPAIPERRQLTLLSMTSRLPEMRKELKRLAKIVDSLESNETSRDAA